nr:cycloartenol synthase [Tanacetum cinerariifolium]
DGILDYVNGKRFVDPITCTVLALRNELFTVPYHNMDWVKQGMKYHKHDLHMPIDKQLCLHIEFINKLFLINPISVI